MVNASRPMKASEYADCAKAGAKQVIEVPIGIDGLTLIEAKDAAGAQPDHRRHLQGARRQPVRQAATPRQTWKDVNPALPAIKIRVLGPPPTSRHARQPRRTDPDQGLRERPGDEGAQEDRRGRSTRTSAPRSARTAPSSKPARTTICWSRRSPPIRARSACSATASSRKMPTRCRRSSIAGVAPTEATISDLSYPGAASSTSMSRASISPAKPAIKDVHRGLCQGMGQGRHACRSAGWCRSARPMPRPRPRRRRALTPLDPASLK